MKEQDLLFEMHGDGAPAAPLLRLIQFSGTARPTEDELAQALYHGARAAVAKWHRGCAPESCDFSFEELLQEVRVRALRRLRNFEHGGKKTLRQFAYMACYFALRDIQRVAVGLRKK